MKIPKTGISGRKERQKGIEAIFEINDWEFPKINVRHQTKDL